MRKIIGKSGEELLALGDAYKIFSYLRYRIEKSGVFVICERVKDHAFKGFCLSDDHIDLIFLNIENQSYKSRVFTIIHELVHLLIGKPGIVDPFFKRIDLERKCNKITASFLLPKKLLRSRIDEFSENYQGIDLLEKIASKIPYSKFFIAIRIEEVSGQEKGLVKKWLAIIKTKRPKIFNSEQVASFSEALHAEEAEEAEEAEDGAFVARHTPASYQVARLGFAALSMAEALTQNGTVSRFDIQSYLNVPAKNFSKVLKSYNNKLSEVSRAAT